MVYVSATQISINAEKFCYGALIVMKILNPWILKSRLLACQQSINQVEWDPIKTLQCYEKSRPKLSAFSLADTIITKLPLA